MNLDVLKTSGKRLRDVVIIAYVLDLIDPLMKKCKSLNKIRMVSPKGENYEEIDEIYNSAKDGDDIKSVGGYYIQKMNGFFLIAEREGN